MEKEERKYYNYLLRLIRTPESKNYIMLLNALWRKEYYSIIPNDQNREKDGIFLRNEANVNINECNLGACSVLEMLIALSRRMEFQLYGIEPAICYKKLFWKLIDNLGLTRFDNLEAAKDAVYLEIDDILTTWIERHYSPNGSGGIFPLKNWRKSNGIDQTKVEIWYQMMSYLDENYEL